MKIFSFRWNFGPSRWNQFRRIQKFCFTSSKTSSTSRLASIFRTRSWKIGEKLNLDPSWKDRSDSFFNSHSLNLHYVWFKGKDWIFFLLWGARSSNFIMAVSIYFTPPYARGEKKIWMPRESNPDEQALQANTTIHNGLSCTIVAVMLSQTGWDPAASFIILKNLKKN